MKARKRLTRDESKEVTRMRLIEAAESLFIRKGFDDTSVEDISETAGYSRGAFYSNFDDKEQVFLAVIDRRRPKALDDIFQQVSGTRGADRRGSGVVLESMAAQGLHRPADGIQPKGDERSLRTKAPRRTAAVRNSKRTPLPWAGILARQTESRLIGRKSSRLCFWPLHTAWAASR